MIKKISSIKSMGIFQNFSWNTGEQNDYLFADINIFYGRNYSGKTTLSRIFRALETGELPQHFEKMEFSILLDTTSTITQSDIPFTDNAIRIFNEDFVRKYLSFLKDTSDPNGEIKTFAVLGAENTRIEEEIKKIQDELGVSEKGKETGLFRERKDKTDENNVAKNNHNEAEKSLEQKLKEKATGQNIENKGIKYRSELFGDQNYTVAKLKNEIQTVLTENFRDISDEKRQELEQSLKEDTKATIPSLPILQDEFETICATVKELVERKIGGSEKIQELINHYALNEWVKRGCELHKGKRTTCAFCGNEISETRWKILEKHFDEETSRLDSDIAKAIANIMACISKIESGFQVSDGLFYQKFKSKIIELRSQYTEIKSLCKTELDKLIRQLNTRKESITQTFVFFRPNNNFSEIQTIREQYEKIRQEANEYTTKMEQVKKSARVQLRLHEVKIFADTIHYTDEVARISELEKKKRFAEECVSEIEAKIKSAQQNIDNLRRQMNDEEKGAREVNAYLSKISNTSLSLEAKDDGIDGEKQIHFEIKRNNMKAYNLSEGECSLIAFCYFLAKLNDVQTKTKNPIIWIDDPISSLDGNHVFLVYSLILAEIVDKKHFKQLFISTHNLEFLKYLKRLTGKNITGRDFEKRWYLIERIDCTSSIIRMPNYMKEYITEFNYLFHKIHKCAKFKQCHDENYEDFYGFGNNARKFLEIYLYYMFPDGVSDKEAGSKRLKKFFGDRVASFFVDRINNEQSHLSGSFERGAMPVAIPEITEVANLILKSIKEHNFEQYNSFLTSIGEKKEEE